MDVVSQATLALTAPDRTGNVRQLHVRRAKMKRRRPQRGLLKKPCRMKLLLLVMSEAMPHSNG